MAKDALTNCTFAAVPSGDVKELQSYDSRDGAISKVLWNNATF
jgi:hypothetical protein